MTVFKGHITAFKLGASNDATPNGMGAPKTDFKGRPAVPAGPLKRYPGDAGNAGVGNRRLAKSHTGTGDGDGVSYSTPTAFGSMKGRKAGKGGKK